MQDDPKTDDIKINALERLYDEENFGIPLRWEPEHVGRRLVKAFTTLDRLPRDRGPREPGGHWPKHTVEWVDRLAQAELSDAERRTRDAARNFTVLRPTSTELAEMEKAFDWLRELRAADSGMALVTSLWALRTARRKSVRRLCTEKQWAPHTFYRKRAKALAYLAELLNSRNAPVF
ncbi:MAG: hypothetical protein WDN02_09345 [Methylovirgula sp.]|uniref:hypothetical protein n=1 Tax=Methylovirgula sp. TaxID=1978224 RepID=UPI0030766C03